MIFYITHDLKTPEGTKQKNLLLGGKFTIGTQSLSVHSFSLVQNTDVRDLVHNVCNFKIGKMPEFTVPVVTVDDNVASHLAMQNVTGLYKQLVSILKEGFNLDDVLAKQEMDKFKELVSLIKEKLRSNAIATKLGDSFEFFIDTILGFYRYAHYTTLSSFDTLANNLIDVDCFSETQDYINSFKKVIVIGDNKTLKQNAYNDEFFINIPSYYTLSNDDLDDVGTLIPNLFSEVCKPYTESVAYTPNYKQVRSTLLKLIEGQSSNNGNLIFQYNERYYKSLLAQVQENIKSYYEDAGNNIQILDQNGNVKDNAVIDPFSQDYLLELCKRLYALHWAHNKSVPCSIVMDDDDKDSGEAREDFSKYEYYLDESFESGSSSNYINALILLESYLKNVSTKCGYKVYVDAVLQLSRWGLDKPTALVFDNYDKVFVLGNNEVRSKAVDLSTCVISKHNGCDRYVAELITLDKEVSDKGLADIPALAQNFSKRIVVPVGVGIATDYIPEDLAKSQNLSQDDVIINYEYYSFIDFIKRIENDNDFVTNTDGVEIGAEGITLAQITKTESISEILEKLHNSSALESYNPFYRSEELTGIYMDIGAKMDSELPSSILTILNNKFASTSLAMDFKAIKFSSKEELISKKRTYQIVGSLQNAIDVSILREVLPIFFKVNKEVEDSADGGVSATTIANVYKRVMDEDFSSEIAFYGSAATESSTAKSSTSESSTKKMDLFSQEQQAQPAQEPKVEPVPHMAPDTTKPVQTEEKPQVQSQTSIQSQTSPQVPVQSQISSQDSTQESTMIRTFCGKGFAKMYPRILLDKENKIVSAIIKTIKKNGDINYFVLSEEEFNTLYPNLFKKINKAMAIKTIATEFFMQCTYTDSLDNHANCVYFNSKESYMGFVQAVLKEL